MCGICGVLERTRPVDPVLLKRMTDVIAHRGPDGEGFFVSGDGDAPSRGAQAGLGARRLAVIDVAAGQQPVTNENGSIHVVFNGEIYNHRALASELRARGHVFRSACDTEVVVHAYEEWGDRAVERFNGMFAFAVWDDRRQRLLLARDRMGVKPLVYYEDGDHLVFGSEIKSLLEDARVPRTLDPEALLGYLAFCAVPETESLFRGIKRLPAGHLLVGERGTTRLERYWDIPVGATSDRRTEREWLEELEALLDDAVRARLISDVPLGAFLSGGIDSSLVVAMMKRHSAHPVTSAMEFVPGPSELPFASLVANAFGTDHRERSVGRSDAWEALPSMVWHHDEPSQSLIQSYFVSKMARERVTVALSGLGGDELFTGYPSHVAAQRFHYMERIPAWARRSASGALGATALTRESRAHRLLESSVLDPDVRFASRHLQATTAEARRSILSPDLLGSVDEEAPARQLLRVFAGARSSRGDFRERLLYVEQKAYLAAELLRATDSMSMAHSLEVRTPFLDYRLVELAARMPMHLKMRGFSTKYALRRLAARLLPPEISRRRKSGFSLPLQTWIVPESEEFVRDHLSASSLARHGCFDNASVSAMLDEHFSGRADRSQWILSLVTFDIWHRLFMQPSPAAALAPVAAPAAATPPSRVAADPDVSIIIVSWNTREITRDCLRSVVAMAGDPSTYEVIVVDNASSDGTPAMIRDEFPDVRLIENRENAGFGRANNQAMRQARGKYFLLLNSDTLIIDDSIQRLAALIATDETIGVASCRLLFGDRRLQYSCYRFPSIRLALWEDLASYKLLSRRRQGELLLAGYWPHDRRRDVDWVSGAVMMVRREVFERTSGFDERLFMYGEDMEWCMRIHDCGWRTVFTPDAQIVHLEHKSSEKKYGDERVDLCHRRLYEIYERRHGRVATRALFAIRTAGALLRATYFGTRMILEAPPARYFRDQARFHARSLRYHLTAVAGRRVAVDS